MLFADCVFVGVDPTSSRRAFTYAALDRDLNLVALTDGEMEEVSAFLAGQQSAVVAINAPSGINHGLVRKDLEARSLTPHQMRGMDMRLAEFELRERGIAVSGTGGRESVCPAWVQTGFELYKKLSKMGFKPYPEPGASHQWLETHPHACYCTLLEQVPFPKPTLEGRLQRGLVLYERGVRIRGAMDFFEEITRHKLMKGSMPLELVYLPEQLDALVAAYTAWIAHHRPADFMRVGSSPEGFISLPVNGLKEKY